MNRLSSDHVQALIDLLCELTTNQSRRSDQAPKVLVITGYQHFFSAGADLNEIASLSGPAALKFSKMGQRLMQLVDDFPAKVFAAVSGYCMGGGLDLALACDIRICAGNAVFGHRGAALGLITGWGGTQRLSSLVGRGRARQMFVAAEKLGASAALEVGLVSEIVADPVARCIELAGRTHDQNAFGTI